MAQQDEHPDIQAFLGFLTRKSVYAVLDSRTGERRMFMPHDVVCEYLKEKGNTRNTRLGDLLSAIFQPRSSPVDPEEILEYFVQVFCILVEIGKGKFIEHFSSEDLSDRLLPFDPDHAAPRNFPTDTQTSLYQDFCQKQWKFCVPDFKSPMASMRYQEQRILPIVSKELIADGGSAVIHKIQLHGSYNKLNRAESDKKPSELTVNTYALKTYLTPDAEKYYKNEVAAFRRLRQSQPSFLIGFYGSFIQGKRFNVILEFADKGTLEDYFANEHPPVRPADIISFWDGMFAAIGALKCLHDVDDEGPNDGPRILHGFHQDVKPANILVISNKSGSAYKWKFRLADLGLSHFKKVVAGHGKVIANDAHGTRAYGAPECYRGDDFIERHNLRIKPNVDIWSLGCVFSEAAIWIAHGYTGGVLEYRRSRQEENERNVGFKDGDCFHDGESVLRVVSKWHSDIITILRQSDHITKAVLDMIEKEMLVPTDYRSTAAQLWFRSRQILQKANEQMEQANLATSSNKTLNEGSLRQPDELPPSSFPPPRPRDTKQMSIRPSRRQVSNGESSAQHGGYFYDRRDDSPDDLMGDGVPGHPVTPPGRRSKVSFSEAENQDGIETYPQALRQPRHADDSFHDSHDRRLVDSFQSRPASVDAQSMRLAESREWTNSEDVFRRSPESTPYLSSDFPEQGISRRRETASTFERTPGRHPNRTLSTISEPEIEPVSIASGQNQSNGEDIPHLSVGVASTWINSRHGFRKLGLRSRQDSLPSHYLLDRLQKRDHVFLIDNSTSMSIYQKDLCSIVRVLAYLVKATDPDGMEMYYTISLKVVKSGDSSKLVKSLAETKFEGITNINSSLNYILGDYGRRINEKFGAGPTVAANTVMDLRPLNLYVLTDGVWQPDCDAETPIKNLVRNLISRRMERHQVGIQFIQFGNDPVGRERLERLDNKLRISGSKDQLDIVDTEPSNGNVWKMLLGAIDPWFDGPRRPVRGSSSRSGGA